MIFLSHQHNDKEIVSPIAYALEKTYGEENVFYDDWSIKPGENIIEKMNEGLEKSRFFFFFITENSLKSKMVSLEWTNALKARSKDMEFIPIRADQVDVPVIISALSYLDMSTNGIDATLQQIREIVSPEVEKYRKDIPTFRNLEGYYYEEDRNTYRFFIRPKRFFEPSGCIIAATNLNKNQAKFTANANMYETGFTENSVTVSARKLNAFLLNFPGGLKAGFTIDLTFKMNENINMSNPNIIIFHQKNDKQLQSIRLTPVMSKSQIPWFN
ncbi:toll/interleukin-1 receptor domain-containing protein [Bacillus marinisedimentorum]|uniref:toll/interleukin-1 receptor domain-containing protein n=1 Tax=Bacillus marinisedimentorum TaxID=1821260 RepID=UPI000872A4F0|nr:toll/interleukin-1 receptor domain-containing protein [Bacillus marinisedimentorum]